MRIDISNIRPGEGEYGGLTLADFTADDGATGTAIMSRKLLEAPGKPWPGCVLKEFLSVDGSAMLKILCLEDEVPGITQFLGGQVWS